MADREPIPAPDGRVAALAEQARLGRWRMGAGDRKGLMGKRWGEARLHLYEEGLVVTDPGGGEWVYRWETTSVYQHLATLNGAIQDATYMLVGPDGAALSVGRGGNGSFKRELPGLGVTSHTRGPFIVYEGQWGPEIQKGVLRTQGNAALERLQRGETLTYGSVSFDRNSVSIKGKSVGWTEVAATQVLHGSLYFNNARNRGVLSCAVPKVANLYLLIALADRLKG
ncbi:DUF6585 family protein [Streptomyces sp. NPDC021096]|uniref:DUF6585 family protein n=1 Tax=Streptomyces sp. NPDC021096 TaxID=3154792 RepID=UPI0033F310B0